MATADNLKIAQQLLATMQQVTAQVERQTEAYHAQVQLVDAICKAQECFSKIDPAKVKEVTEALKEAQEKTKDFGKQVADTTDKEVSRLEGKVKELADRVAKLSVPGEFLSGFRSGFKLSTNFFKNILSLGGTAFGVLKDIGKVLLSLPGRLLDFFQGSAQGGTDEYKVALEELRKEFGDLDIGTSKAIKNMTESTKAFGESGLALSKVYGFGRAGLAARLRENIALFKEMGPLGDRLAESIKGAEGEFALLRKATGLSGEAFKSFQLSVEESGGDGVKAVRDMTKEVALFTKQFGISSKIYGKDLEFMMKETQTFGIKAPRELLKVSTYVRKLGISVEALKKTIDKSFNFEDAADQASKLSEAFNIRISSMDLFKAKGPEKLELLRKGFHEAGQNIEQMDEHQRRYLSSTLDMDDATLRTAFSQKNRALTGAALDAQMKKNTKTNITQEEAMQNLAKSIERLVKSGEAMKGGFFETFFKGFEYQIKRSKEFREIVYALQRAMKVVWNAGRQTADLFLHMWPDIMKVMDGLQDMFNPARFKELMNKVVGEFRNFFRTIQTDPRAGVEEFMKNMKKHFFDFFSKSAPAGSKFLDGLKTFYRLVGMIIIQGYKQALTSLRDILGAVIGYIRDPSSLKRVAGGAGSAIKGTFVEIFTYVVTELGPVLKEVGAKIVELLSLVFEKYIKPHLAKIVMALFGPALFMGVTRALGAAILKVGFEKVISSFVSRIPTPKGVGAAARGAGAAGKAGEAATGPGGAAELKNFAVNLAKIALVMAAIAATVKLLMPLILSIARDIENSGLSPQSLVATGLLLGIMGVLFAAIGNMMKAIGTAKITPEGAANVLKAIVASLLILPAIAVIAKLAVFMLGDIPIDQIAKTAFTMSIFTFLFIAIGMMIPALASSGKLIDKFKTEIVKGLLGAGAILVLLIPVAWLAIKVLGGFTMSEVLTTVAALGSMAVLFGGIAALFVVLAVLGATVSATGGAAIGTAAIGFGVAVGTLIGLAFIANQLIEHLKTIKEEDAKVTFLIMDSIVEVFMKVAFTIGGLGLVAALIGKAVGTSPIAAIAATAALVAMLGAVAVVMTSLLDFAKDFITLTSNSKITEAQAKAVGSVLESLSKMLTAVVDGIAKLMVISRSSVLGAFIGVDGGVDTMIEAKNLLVGSGDGDTGIMGAIQTMLQGQGKTKGMLQVISELSGDPEQLKAKASVFVLIAEGFAAIMKPIVDLLQAVVRIEDSTWFSDSTQATLKSFNDILTGEKTGILEILFKPNEGMVPKIIEQIKTINTSEGESLKTGAEVFKSITTGIGAMMQVFPDMLKSINELYRGVGGMTTEELGKIFDKMKELMTNVISHTSGLIRSFAEGIRNLLGSSQISPEKLQAAGSVGEIFRGIGELIKAITPSADTIKAFQTVTESQSSEGGSSTSTTAVNGEALKAYMTDIANHLTTVIGDNNSGIIKMIRTVAAIPFNQSELERLKVIAPILAAIGDLISHIVPSQNILDRITQQVAGSEHRGTQASHNKDLIRNFMINVTSNLLYILPAVQSFISNVADKIRGLDANTIKGLEAIGPIMVAIGSLINSIMPSTAILDRITVTGSGGLDAKQMANNQKAVSGYFATLNSYMNVLLYGADPTPSPVGGVVGFIQKISTILRDSGLDESKIKGLSIYADVIKSIVSFIVPMVGALQSATEGVTTAGDEKKIREAGTQVTSIINSMSSSLTSIFEKIPALVATVTTMPTKGLTSKVEAVKGMFDMIGAIISISNSLRTSTTSASGATHTNVQSVLDTINPVMNLIIGLFSTTGYGDVAGYGVTTQVALNLIATFPVPAGLKGKADILKATFEAIKTVIDATKALKDVATGQTTAYSATILDIPLQGVANVIRSLTSTNLSVKDAQGNWLKNPFTDDSHDNPLSKLASIAGRVTGVTPHLSTIKDKLSELFGAVNTIGSLSLPHNVGTNLQGSLDRLFSEENSNAGEMSVLSALNNHFGDDVLAERRVARIQAITTNLRDRIVQPVHDLVTSYNEFAAEIGNLNSVTPLRVTLENLGAKMGAQRSLTVRNAAVNAQINITVEMKTAQVVQSIDSHSQKGTTAANPVRIKPDNFEHIPGYVTP